MVARRAVSGVLARPTHGPRGVSVSFRFSCAAGGDCAALSFSSAEGFVVCGEEHCDLVKSDDTVEENYITFYPQPE